MQQTIVKSQEEYDVIPPDYAGEIIIDAPPNSPLCINTTPKGATVNIAGYTQIHQVYGSAQINEVYDSAQIRDVCGSAQINVVCGAARIRDVCGLAQIHQVYGSAQISNVYGSAQINVVCGAARIINVYDSAQIRIVCGSARITQVYGLARINVVCGAARIINVYDSAQINWIGGLSFVNIRSNNVAVRRARQQALISLVDCVIEINTSPEVVIARRTTNYSFTPVDYTAVHEENVLPDGRILLYKSVTAEDTDFCTGQIKYEGTVECPDWDPNLERQCGGGLHLSPTPQQALDYNQGKILECAVALEDFVVYKTDLSKVRCRQVEVLGVYNGDISQSEETSS